MNELEIYNNEMTVFYSKRTGKIKALCQGNQEFSFFGEDSEDMELIFGRLITNYSNKVFMNPDMYLVVEEKIKVNPLILETFEL